MIYNAYLAFKHRPRLSVWGKIVVWCAIICPCSTGKLRR